MAQCKGCGSEVTGSPRFCPTCGSPLETGEPVGGFRSKEAREPKSMARRVGMVLFPILLIVGMAIFINYVNPSIHPVIEQQPMVASPADYDSSTITAFDVRYREDGNDLVFPLTDLKEHRLVRFEYKTATLTRPVLAYIAPDGRLVTAISVSEHCGSTEFKIKNNKIYCARCPSYWDMMTMEAYACCAKYYPDPIPSRIQGNEVHIARNAIEMWAGRL